jgi:hypothetical protein
MPSPISALAASSIASRRSLRSSTTASCCSRIVSFERDHLVMERGDEHLDLVVDDHPYPLEDVLFDRQRTDRSRPRRRGRQPVNEPIEACSPERPTGRTRQELPAAQAQRKVSIARTMR